MAARLFKIRCIFVISLSLGALAGLLYGIAFSSLFKSEARRQTERRYLDPLTPAPPPSMLLISVDALRPDYLGIYGSRRGASPNIDQWAHQAAVVERAYCQVPHTSFSLTSLHVGTSLYLDEETLRERPPPTIAEILAAAGYETAAFFPPAVFFIDGPSFSHYRRRYFGFHHVHYQHLDAAQRVDQLLVFLQRYRSQPFFVWAHFFDTHEPYRERPGFTSGKRAEDRYAGEIAYVDHHLGRLLAHLAAEHPNTAVLLTADHGEEFGETGAYYHGNSLHQPQIRVPWILQAPGLSPRRLPGPAQVIDAPVTLLALAGRPPPPSMHGRNLLPWLRGATARPWPPALSELDFQKVLLTGQHALLCNYQEPVCQLYDLARGPRALLKRSQDPEGALRLSLERQLATALAERTATRSQGQGLSACQQLLRRIKRRDPNPLGDLPRLCTTSEERLQMVELLLRLRSPLALEPLVLASADPEPEIRRQAVIGAARLGHPPSLASLPKLLQTADLSPALRREALIALAKADNREAAQQLVELLEGSQDLYEQVELISLLGQLRFLPAEDAILARLDHLRTRLAAIHALAQLGSRRAIPELIETLQSTRYITWRRAAALALGQLADRLDDPRVDRQVREALGQALREEIEPDVVLAALRSWLRINGGQIPGLRALPVGGWRCEQGKGCTLSTQATCDGSELLLLAGNHAASKPLLLHCGDRLLAALERPQQGALIQLKKAPGEVLRLQTRSERPLPLQLLGLRKAP